MAWTTTLDASKSGAIKALDKAHRRGRWSHLGRDVDVAAGFKPVRHSNLSIDPNRTALNRTLVNDGHGGFRRPTVVDGRRPSMEFDDYLESRLETVTGRVAKNSVGVRGFVLKLDNAWWDAHCPDWKRTGVNDEALRILDAGVDFIGQFMGGQQNVIGYVDHLDEGGYPERQIMTTPITEDHRLSQTDFFTGKASMSKMHQDLRTHLRGVGYDASMQVKEDSKVSREPEALKQQQAKLDAGAAELDETHAQVMQGWAKLQGKVDEVIAYEKNLINVQEQLDTRSAELDSRESVMVAGEQWVDTEKQRVSQVAADLGQREKQVTSREAQVTSSEQDFSRKHRVFQQDRHSLDEAQRQVAANQKQVDTEKQRVAANQRQVSLEQQQLANQRAALHASQRAFDEEKHQVEQERQRLAAGHAAIDTKLTILNAQIKRFEDGFDNIERLVAYFKDRKRELVDPVKQFHAEIVAKRLANPAGRAKQDDQPEFGG